VEPTNEPDAVLAGHSEKIYFIKFHPLAEDVLASGSYDMTVRIWDLATRTDRIVLQGHTDQVCFFTYLNKQVCFTDRSVASYAMCMELSDHTGIPWLLAFLNMHTSPLFPATHLIFSHCFGPLSSGI
jgi:WD40 repeat protein